ncbi:MAG: hypothetical protein DWQ45_03430 [Planctomycetota bacterium]|nr:MAG: hypothetical protein DWQ29_21020 [Planctomycetota bacterium]REK23452.1 MAG: hypothetical protein DWQ41_17025 [Planctomycetota bacterium]REK38908.1 MAG: hypothetical protein DWQ45_03430 [Planctomycetota bacterium]
MKTFFVDSRSGRISLAEFLRSVDEGVTEIRRHDGRHAATLQLAAGEQEFDYSSYIPDAIQAVQNYLDRGADRKPGVTTQQLFDTLNQLEASG